MSPADTFHVEAVFIEDKNFNHLHQSLNSEKLKPLKLFILTDKNIASVCLPLLEDSLHECKYDIITVPAGEENKNLESCRHIWESLTFFEADRFSLLMNLGGGMVTDLGGFAASVYKRGISFLHIPTTLLGMVDASIGGKTGIDFNLLKNQIGTFSSPEGVFIYPGFLETLDQRNRRAGLAEMIKHALIAEPLLWEQMITFREKDFYTAENIKKSASIKLEIVQKDPLEKGLRKILNFGHTFGHAFESYSLRHQQHKILHGEAVAMGMICEARLSTEILGFDATEADRIVKLILRLFDKFNFPETHMDELIQLMRQDKKNKDSGIGFSLLKEPSLAVLDVFPGEEKIRDTLNWYNTL